MTDHREMHVLISIISCLPFQFPWRSSRSHITELVSLNSGGGFSGKNSLFSNISIEYRTKSKLAACRQKSPQSVLSDPPEPTNPICTDFSNLHLYSIFPQNREIEKRRQKLTGKKRCTHALTDNITSNPWDTLISKLSQFHLRTLFYLFSAQLAPTLSS